MVSVFSFYELTKLLDSFGSVTETRKALIDFAHTEPSPLGLKEFT